MTPPSGPLINILRAANVLLLDFDGPICAIFAGHRAPVVAEELRRVIAANGAEVPTDARNESDPLCVLRLSADACPPGVVRAVSDALRDIEVKATESAAATPGTDELLQSAHDTARRIAIVSNNSAEAVRAYLERHDLDRYVDHISARYDGMDLRLLKPSPHLVDRALVALDASPTSAVLIGDSPADAVAGSASGVAVIGYANKPGKRATLRNAGAATVIETLAELSSALRSA